MRSLILIFILLNTSYALQWRCDFDYGDKCLIDLSVASYVLLNETSDKPRQPVSDVWAIQTSSNQDSCRFPFLYGSFDMYFCVRTSNDTPAVCESNAQPSTLINCNDGGEYGYHAFDENETDDQSYQLDIPRTIDAGPHCLRLYHFFSDNQSDASIQVVMQDVNNMNQTILEVYPQPSPDRWREIRHSFVVINSISKVYFVFRRRVSTVNPFFIAIDEIQFLDTICDYTAIEQQTTTISIASTGTTEPMSVNATGSSSPESTIIGVGEIHNSTDLRLNETNTSPPTTARSTSHGPPVCNRTITTPTPHNSTNSATNGGNIGGGTDSVTPNTIVTTKLQISTMEAVVSSVRTPPSGSETPSRGTPVSQTPTPSRGTPVSQTPTPSRGTPVSQTPTPSRGTPIRETTSKPSLSTSLISNVAVILSSVYFGMVLTWN